ncbi:MAG: hypothetical protein LAO22_14210 [Acidobacteriia bacterium]|nr:hypothetical protein [Terriglobia bacterium]
MDNMGNLVLNLTNAEGNPAEEPNCRVEVVRLDQVTIARADHLQFPPQHRFTLPAFPQAQNLHCVITPSRYRLVQSSFFTLTDGQEMKQTASVMRDPGQWQPKFAGWNSLSGQFDPLSSPALLLAKMALLNLFAVLRTQPDPVSTEPWFNFVKQILVLDQERFVAIVSADLFESIDHIVNHLGDFRKQGFFPGDVSLHFDNIPSEFQITAPMISVKRAYEQGNVQFTLGKATNQQGDCVLLDCDMDENSNLFGHAADFFTHLFTGGNIVHQQKGVDLGYELRPRDEGLAPIAVASPKRTSRLRSVKRA